MLKRFIVIFSIICAGFVLGSCSDALDRTSSVSFKLSDSFFREALNSSVSDSSAGDISDEPAAAEEYAVKVTVNWDNGNRVDGRTVVLKENGKIDCPEFTFDDLPVGKTVKIDVSISCGGKTIYSMEEPDEIILKAGKNKCEVKLEKQVADVLISIGNKDSLKLDSSYKLVVEITDSSNKIEKSEYSVCDENTYKIAENKLIGETLEISVFVYNNSLCLYKTLEPHSVAVPKENNVQVTLSNAVSTAAVWQCRRDLEYIDGYKWNLYQNKSYSTEKETDSLAECVTYTFSADGKLVTLASTENNNDNSKNLTFKVYELDSETLTYSSKESKTFPLTWTNATYKQVKDIYCDSGFLYILQENNANGSVFSVIKYSIEAGTSDEITVDVEGSESSFTALAVKNDLIMLSSGTKIFYANFKNTSTLDFKEVQFTFDIPTSDDSDPVITDLQFGDGLGNDTDKLYVLVRNHPDFGKPDDTSTVVNVYSCGALIEINMDGYAAQMYGYEPKSESISVSASSKKYTCNIVSPGATTLDSSHFYGPYKFVALAPRKLVILDDGICVKTDDNGNNKFTNNDALFEFDIANNTLTRGASVDASILNASGFDTDW